MEEHMDKKESKVRFNFEQKVHLYGIHNIKEE